MNSNPNNSRRFAEFHSGFSLLELMIVLVIMVGVLAIAWPNLQKPFRRAELSQATQQLREAIDESRYQAISTGTPVFIRLKMGESKVVAGGFETFAASKDSMTFDREDGNVSALQNNVAMDRSQDPESSTPKVWKLPENVVISDVTWSQPEDDLEAEWGSEESSLDGDRSIDMDSAQPMGRLVSSRSDRAEIDQSPEAFELLPGSEQVWWLPVSSLNQGRDVEITLWDKDSHESMRVSLSSATGELEIHR
jgi:prepilin-type N-terminal cleavage/methylation domain-containing protein